MTSPNNYPAPTMVYGGAPSFQDADPVEQYHAAPSEFHEAPTDELATLRADNDARGVLIERLRADLACTATELDIVCSERDALLAEMNEAYEVCTKMARQKDELHHAVEIANARADRQAARAERAEAETARQQRLVALFVRVLREMTPEAP